MKSKLYLPILFYRDYFEGELPTLVQWLEALPDIQALGVKHLEIPLYTAEMAKQLASGWKRIKGTLTAHGMNAPVARIADVSLFLNPETVEAAWEDYKAAITVLDDIGVKYVQLDVPRAQQLVEYKNAFPTIDDSRVVTEIDLDELAAEVRTIEDVVTRIAALCAQEGMDLVVEPRVMSHFATPGDITSFIARSGVTNLKVTFDCTHIVHQGLSADDAWLQLRDIIVLAHVSDADDNSHHAEIGSGNVPWARVLKLIGESDIVEYVGIEVSADSSEATALAVKSGIKGLQNLIDSNKLSDNFELEA